MTDLGPLHHFLDIAVTRTPRGLFLSQRQYATDLLCHAGMLECHATTTPMDTWAKLSATDGSPVADPSEYQSLAGALQYLTLTRLDIAYVVQHVWLHMHAPPWEPHLALIKRILHNVKGTIAHGLQLSCLLHDHLDCLLRCRLGQLAELPPFYVRLLCLSWGQLVSWSSKRWTTISHSSTKAEYRVVAHVVAECCWLCQLL